MKSQGSASAAATCFKTRADTEKTNKQQVLIILHYLE